MSDDEPWDAKRVAAECAKTAREKAGPVPLRPGESPPIPITSIERPSAADVFRDELRASKMGAPTKFKPEYVEQVRKLAQFGATNVEMAEFFEVAESTFQLWLNVHPDFNEAVKVGKEKPDERTVRSMYEIANGYDYFEDQAIKLRDADGNESIEIVKVQKHQPPDPRAGQFWLTNRRPHDWQVKRTIEHVPGDRTISPDEARKALAEWYGKEGEIIDVTPTRITLPSPPESEENTK